MRQLMYQGLTIDKHSLVHININNMFVKWFIFSQVLRDFALLSADLSVLNLLDEQQ